MRKWVGLASKPTTDKGAVHIDLMHRNLEYVGQSSVDIVRDLLRCVERQSTRGAPVSNHSMRLSRSVIHTREQPILLVTGDRTRSHSIDIAELLENSLLNIRLSDVILSAVVDWIF